MSESDALLTSTVIPFETLRDLVFDFSPDEKKEFLEKWLEAYYKAEREKREAEREKLDKLLNLLTPLEKSEYAKQELKKIGKNLQNALCMLHSYAYMIIWL